MKHKFKTIILLTGGTGTLGSQIQKHIDAHYPDIDVFSPSKKELDITDSKQCGEVIQRYNPDVILHVAAYTDVVGAENNKNKCWAINVQGTENLIKIQRLSLCISGEVRPPRFVYISTDYVFDGEKGNYKEEDIPNPVNYYALTKLFGEVIIRQYPDTLVIRTAFKPNGPWKYENAFIDQYSSHEFVDVIVPDIAKAVLMQDLVGTIHIAGKRKRMYDLAKQASPNVGKMYRADVQVNIPKDTSLNTNKWKKIIQIFSKLKRLKK